MTPAQAPQYLFAYGTLQERRAPAALAHVVSKLEKVASGRVVGHLYDFGEYPGAVLSGTGDWIEGDIFFIHDFAIFQQLDEYEGYLPDSPGQSLFLRKRCLVSSLPESRGLLCWIYEYNHARQPKLSN